MGMLCGFVFSSCFDTGIALQTSAKGIPQEDSASVRDTAACNSAGPNLPLRV